MNGHASLSLKRICLPGSLGHQLRCFSAGYACKALWERPSPYPYKLVPPIFQTGTYYPL